MNKYTITDKTTYYVQAESREEALAKYKEGKAEGSETHEPKARIESKTVKDHVSHMVLSYFEDIVKEYNLDYGDISPSDNQRLETVMEELEDIYKKFIKYNNFNRGGKK